MGSGPGELNHREAKSSVERHASVFFPTLVFQLSVIDCLLNIRRSGCRSLGNRWQGCTLLDSPEWKSRAWIRGQLGKSRQVGRHQHVFAFPRAGQFHRGFTSLHFLPRTAFVPSAPQKGLAVPDAQRRAQISATPCFLSHVNCLGGSWEAAGFSAEK